METKRLLIGLALTGMFACQALVAADVQITNDIKDPKKTIIRWDLDDTIVKKVPYKPLVRKNSVAILYCLMRHPVTFFQQIKTKACSEEWQETFKGFNKDQNSYEHRFAQMIQQISQEKQLLPGMQELLQKLHDLGYEQHAITNMGEKDYQYLQQAKPEVFNLFSHATYVTYNNTQKKIKKPMPEYFTNVVASDKNVEGKTSLFIDDKDENCQVAQKTVGWDSIKVPGNATNAEFLTNVLRQHGVAV